MAKLVIARRLTWVPEAAKIKEVDSDMLGEYVYQVNVMDLRVCTYVAFCRAYRHARSVPNVATAGGHFDGAAGPSESTEHGTILRSPKQPSRRSTKLAVASDAVHVQTDLHLVHVQFCPSYEHPS